MMRLPVAAAVHLCLGLNTDDLLRDKSSTLRSQVHYASLKDCPSLLYLFSFFFLVLWLVFWLDMHSTKSCLLTVLRER